MIIYDPPSGWQYGFPKAYNPLPGETLADTLRRDGYPQKEIDWGADQHVCFLGPQAELDALDFGLDKKDKS